MKLNEVAKLTGITIRTLHYYDEIGLLKPSQITEVGYRLYDENNLSKLQQILFFKELDFPLDEIKEIMTNLGYDKTEALKKHKELMIKKRWGNTKEYNESEKKTQNYGKEQWQEVNNQCNDILKAFADNMDKAPDSKEVQKLVKEWQGFITKRFYKCTNEILKGLGLMYVADERFRKNIDSNGNGTAEFLSKAIAIYCKK